MKQDLYDKIVEYIIENQNKFYRLAFSYLRNQEDALDVVQNAVCKALEHYESLRNEQAVRTWFYRILVNESLLFLREKKKLPLAAAHENPELPYEEKGFELPYDFSSSLSCLDEDVQTIIRLRFFEELSLKEIAAVTDMNLNTVKAKLYRGLKLLKVTIQEVDL